MEKAYWTTRDISYLIDNWGKLPTSAIAAKLGRTVNAVKGQRRQLGLPSLYAADKDWREDECRYLLNNWSKRPVTYLAARLRRTEDEVLQKAKILELPEMSPQRAKAIAASVTRDLKNASKNAMPKQRKYDVKPGDEVIALYLSKTAEYEDQEKKRKSRPRKCRFTVTAVYPHIFQARLEETRDIGIIVELSKNDYVAGIIVKA